VIEREYSPIECSEREEKAEFEELQAQKRVNMNIKRPPKD